jgi:hypothetical protein
MVNLRRALESSCLAIATLMSVALLAAAGCGKPAPPPQGSPQSADAPTVDLGTESGPEQPAAGSNDSSSGAQSPQAEQGDKK